MIPSVPFHKNEKLLNLKFSTGEGASLTLQLRGHVML